MSIDRSELPRFALGNTGLDWLKERTAESAKESIEKSPVGSETGKGSIPQQNTLGNVNRNTGTEKVHNEARLEAKNESVAKPRPTGLDGLFSGDEAEQRYDASNMTMRDTK
ncbi:hypothetical protein KAI87_14575 [Myxococcota bacterium]|nr:hypothetical protein [Myxococcota bacterium]